MQSNSDQAAAIAVVVVVYNQSLATSTSLITLNAALQRIDAQIEVIVYDNSPHAQPVPAADFKQLTLHYIHDATNPGVSTAYNYVAKRAVSAGKQFLLLLDQDTTLPCNFMEVMLTAITRYEDQEIFAPRLFSGTQLFSPCKYYFKKGIHLDVNRLNVGVNRLSHISFLNSGLLLKLTAFQAVGGFDENIRLYFSDFDFIDRLRSRISTYVLIDANCGHDLSSNESADRQKALFRFTIYCRDGRAATKGLPAALMYSITIGLRAVKLSLSFRAPAFLQVFFNSYVRAN